MSLAITPLRNLVLVRFDEEPEVTGAIQVVRTEGRPPSCFATVLALGPDVRDAQIGAPVVISRLQGVEVADGLLIPEDAILAYREDETVMSFSVLREDSNG